MTSPGKERVLRLTWTRPDDSVNIHEATIGPFRLVAWAMGWWEVRAGGASVVDGRSVLTVGAQHAAEAAALKLVCDVVAALVPDDDIDHTDIRRAAEVLTPDGMLKFASALIARAARKDA